MSHEFCVANVSFADLKKKRKIERLNSLFDSKSFLSLNMSNKAELQRKLKEIGYEFGPFASKDTLSNVLRLHSLVRNSISLVLFFVSMFSFIVLGFG